MAVKIGSKYIDENRMREMIISGAFRVRDIIPEEKLVCSLCHHTIQGGGVELSSVGIDGAKEKYFSDRRCYSEVVN